MRSVRQLYHLKTVSEYFFLLTGGIGCFDKFGTLFQTMGLWDVCVGGQIEEVRAALEKGEDINDTNSKNQTVLMFTATKCDDEKYVSILKLLLEQPSLKVNLAETTGGMTALHIASNSRNIEAVKVLSANPRVDVNIKDSLNETPLMASTRSEPGRIDIFKLLLAEPRVEVNCTLPHPDIGDMTPLMLAALHVNAEATKLLLADPRVEVNWLNSRGMGALHVAVSAIQKSDVKLIKLFLANPRVDVNVKDCATHGRTVLHDAAYSNNVEAVKLILEEPRFTSANVVDEHWGRRGRAGTHKGNAFLGSFTAVSVAVVRSNFNVLKELVHHPSIDLDLKDKDGRGIDDLVR